MQALRFRDTAPDLRPTYVDDACVKDYVGAIDALAIEGGLDPVLGAGIVLSNLELCNSYHWSAYAALANRGVPDASMIAAIKAVYLNR